METCCIFSCDTPSTEINYFKYEVLQDLGDKVYNDDGSVRHYTYMWDTGVRKVIRCKNCNAIFVFQYVLKQILTQNELNE